MACLLIDDQFPTVKVRNVNEQDIITYEQAQLKGTDGDMNKQAVFHENLSAQRSEYMDTFVLKMLNKVYWIDETNNDKIQSFLIDFRTFPGNQPLGNKTV